MKQTVKVSEAADKLGVDRKTIIRWISEGVLAGTKMGKAKNSNYLIPASELVRLKVAESSSLSK